MADDRADDWADDWADRHVARLRDHWTDVAFDDEVEAMWTRMSLLMRHLKDGKQAAVRSVGLEDFQYDTLHQLMVRDTPGHASPTELALDLGVSAAGMTGRLDAMVKAGWVERRTSSEDRRRVEISATEAGVQVWRAAIQRYGRYEDELAAVLSQPERASLNRLLKKITLVTERGR